MKIKHSTFWPFLALKSWVLLPQTSASTPSARWASAAPLPCCPPRWHWTLFLHRCPFYDKIHFLGFMICSFIFTSLLIQIHKSTRFVRTVTRPDHDRFVWTPRGELHARHVCVLEHEEWSSGHTYHPEVIPLFFMGMLYSSRCASRKQHSDIYKYTLLYWDKSFHVYLQLMEEETA